jgi:hypothetical protein
MMTKIFALLIIASGSLWQDDHLIPHVTPVFSGGAPQFSVEVLNTMSISVLPFVGDGHCWIRLDGVAEPETLVSNGPDPKPVRPGQSWRELIGLRTDVSAPQARYYVDDYTEQSTNRGALLTPGNHMIAFRCGFHGAWTADIPFVWRP